MRPVSQASEIKSRIGVVPQIDNLDLELTVRENLEMYGRYFDVPPQVAGPRIDDLLDFVQLTEGHRQGRAVVGRDEEAVDDARGRS